MNGHGDDDTDDHEQPEEVELSEEFAPLEVPTFLVSPEL
jgi:hypothetical protein